MQTPRSSRQHARPKNTPPRGTPKTRRKKRRAINFLPQKVRFGSLTKSLLGLKFLYLLNKYQSGVQSKIANIATKTAILSAPSKGKTAKIKAAAHQASKKTIGKASKYLASCEIYTFALHSLYLAHSLTFYQGIFANSFIILSTLLSILVFVVPQLSNSK